MPFGAPAFFNVYSQMAAIRTLRQEWGLDKE
jgi:hypothetical protein